MNKKNKHFNRFLMIALLLMASGVSATKAILVVDATLKDAPDFNGGDLALLTKGESIDIKQRERGWYEIVRSNQQTGWITMLQVRFEAMKKTHNSSTVSRVVSLRKGHSQVNATTGVRGIGEADIKKAKANFAALKQVKKYQAGELEAKEYAQKIPLLKLEIDYEEKASE